MIKVIKTAAPALNTKFRKLDEINGFVLFCFGFLLAGLSNKHQSLMLVTDYPALCSMYL